MKGQLLTGEEIVVAGAIANDSLIITNKRLIHEENFVAINQINRVTHKTVIVSTAKFTEDEAKRYSMRTAIGFCLPIAIYVTYISEIKGVESSMLSIMMIFGLLFFTVGLVLLIVTFGCIAMYNRFTMVSVDKIELSIVKTDNTLFFRKYYNIQSLNEIQNFELLLNDAIFSKV